MKILDIDYFVKGHHNAETYAAAHEVCKTIILDNKDTEFRDPDAANTRIFVEFAVYVSMVTDQTEIGQSLIQDFQFCVSKVDPEIYIDDRRQLESPE